jgi:hypothetical protein
MEVTVLKTRIMTDPIAAPQCPAARFCRIARVSALIEGASARESERLVNNPVSLGTSSGFCRDSW